MSDIDRIIGELREFKRATLAELAELKKYVQAMPVAELEALRIELKSVQQWKWKIAGGVTALSLVITAGFNLLMFLKR